MISTAVTSANCARLKTNLTGGSRRSSSATSVPASTAKNACVPVAKTSASVSGMSVSENACELRRNSQLDRPALGDEHHEASAHQAISGPWTGP